MNADVFWSVTFLLTACAAALWLAYGSDPSVALQLGGLHLLTLTRRLQWVLLVATVVPCLGLIVRVSIGRANVAWLAGLSIVVALLFVRFSPDTKRPVRILETSSMPTVAEAGLDLDDEFVVGFEFQDVAYALPYRSVYRTPIVQITDFDRRALVIFSPYANSATVLDVTREVRATDLEYHSAPDNSTLVYNRKYGEFIVGVTGATDTGAVPTGVRGRVDTRRVPLREWRRTYPESRLMMPTPADAGLPGVPLMPRYEVKLADTSLPSETPVLLIHTTPPVAMLMGESFDEPALIQSGKLMLVLWSDAGQTRCFVRSVDEDLFLTFEPRVDGKRHRYVDAQTNSVWTPDGRCVEGLLKGKKLSEIRVEENVYWGVSKTWWPDLTLIRRATSR